MTDTGPTVVPRTGIQIAGLNRFVRELRRFDPDMANLLRVENRGIAEQLTPEAAARAPRLTGALAGSGRAGVSQRSGLIRFGRASVPYANPIHWGWPRRNIRPQPFVIDTIDARRSDIERRYTQAVERLLDRMNWTEGPTSPGQAAT